MARTILLLLGVFSIVGCRNVPRDRRINQVRESGIQGSRMDIGFEISYEKDGARVAIKGRV